MRLSQVLWATLKCQCRSCAYTRLIYVHSPQLTPYQCFPLSYRLKSNIPSLEKDFMFKLTYATNTTPSKNNEAPEKTEPTKAKKKKEIKVFITLLGIDGNITVTTVEEARKLASRRNMRLVKDMDLDPKTGRAVYKLMTESEYLKGDMDWDDPKSKKGKDKSIKGDKVVSLSSTTAEHDVLTKVKMMQKWLEKKLEVKVVITGDAKGGENVFKIIEKEIGTDKRIVQKRVKGQDIRFQILPPKRTEGTQTVKEET